MGDRPPKPIIDESATESWLFPMLAKSFSRTVSSRTALVVFLAWEIVRQNRLQEIPAAGILVWGIICSKCQHFFRKKHKIL